MGTEPLGRVAQYRVFTELHGRLFRNSLRIMLQRSRLRLALILFLSLLIWGGLYALFREGFVFLRNLETTVPISYRIIELLFGMFFLSLTGLMVFSTGLLLHESLFRAPECRFLLTTPALADQIFGYKFKEAVFFSGWAFLLLGSPLLVAYGIEMGAAWPYYVLFVPYLVGFLLLPAAIGALGCFLIVDLFPRQRRLVLLLLLLGVGATVSWIVGYLIWNAQIEGLSEVWLRRLIDHLRPSQWRALPSRWMTAGLMAGANNQFGEAIFNLGLVWSNGLFFYLVASLIARKLYRRAYNRAQSTGGKPGFLMETALRWLALAFDGTVNLALAWTDHRTRLFVLKDLRTFRRDPVQWAQVLILGGILFLYFVNIPRLPHSQYALYQRTLIGLLNVAVIGLMLATYTSRFVFPMMSLEGRNFWILGLLPVSRERLLFSKFAYAATVTGLTSLGLALLSEVMLRLPWPVLVVHLITMLVLSLGLSAISVGLGTYLVNLKESNPSKIATGFGGTINLLVSLIFAVVAILLAGVPTFIYFADVSLRHMEIIDFARVRFWLAVGLGSLTMLGIVAVVLPLRLGMRAFRRMEF
jgi:ABC-2 type transport system permease protein